MSDSPITLHGRGGGVVFQGTQSPGGGSQTVPTVFAPVRLVEFSIDLPLTGAATIDGSAVTTGDRVMLRGQSDPIEDGLWVANTAGAWTRPDDFADGTVVANGSMFLAGYAGGVWYASLWLLNTDDAELRQAVVGTDSFDNIDPIFAYGLSSISNDATGPSVHFGMNNGSPALAAFGATLYDGGEPVSPLDGLTLYVDAGVLKYKLHDGSVKTVTVTP